MELLYEVKQPVQPNSLSAGAVRNALSDSQLKCSRSEGRPICSISVKNLIAFTSSNDLLKKEPNQRAIFGSPEGLKVYVADLNTPWECYLVCFGTNKITNLNWDHAGVKLLVATDDGRVEIYGMVENLLNKWHSLSKGRVDGEPIIASCWLNPPRKVCLVPDKLDSILYSEKYDVSLITNERGFGGRSPEGAIVVTSTGLVGAILLSSDDSANAKTSIAKLLAARSRITCTDIAYAKDGGLVVVSSSEKLNQPIQLNRVHVASGQGSSRDRAEIDVKPSQSLFLPFVPDTEITAVKFIHKMNTEALLIALTNIENRSSTLYLYELVSEQISLKLRFQTPTTESITSNKWEQICQISFSSAIEELCVLPLPIALKTATQPQNANANMSAIIQPLISVSLANSCIHLVRSDTLQQVGVTSSAGANLKREREDGPPEPKQAKLSNSFGNNVALNRVSRYVSLQFSWSSCLLVALDEQSQLHLYKVHPNMDACAAALMLEMSMMGGLDPWDIMMCLRPNLIEHVTDRLSEAFARQPQPVQNRFNARILVIKAALFRLGGITARANDQQTLLILHLVSGALKALLRPSDLSSQDKGPAESLSNLLSSKGEALSDVDKVLLHVEPKEYTVEPSLLQSLQQFLQWCADLALKLLAAIPDIRHSKTLGWEVCRDSKAVGTLRELIVLMRIWGLIRSSCLPQFRKTTEHLDVLPLLFRLLTRLSVTPHDPDEALIDDCCILPSEVQIPNGTNFSTKNNGVASVAFFSRTSTLQFTFGVKPSKWLNNSEGQRTNRRWMDGLRLLWLDQNNSSVKRCNRCGCATLIQAPPRSVANKSWDNRWIRNCPCGGNWKISSPLLQTKTTDDSFLNF